MIYMRNISAVQLKRAKRALAFTAIKGHLCESARIAPAFLADKNFELASSRCRLRGATLLLSSEVVAFYGSIIIMEPIEVMRLRAV